MEAVSDCLILIPARMGATRLPGKPLLKIGDVPMIVHVFRRAQKAQLGRVVVATDCEEIVDVVTGFGGEAILTRNDHASGSDRVYEAANRLDPQHSFDIVINLQGDLPTIEPSILHDAIALLDDPLTDIGTLAAEIKDENEAYDPNVVKVIGSPIHAKRLRALYFTRAAAPYGEGPLYHHIGLYVYRRPVLDQFVTLAPSLLEKRERLEQLRAIEAGMRIDVGLVDQVPYGVDTPEDLALARQMLV